MKTKKILYFVGGITFFLILVFTYTVIRPSESSGNLIFNGSYFEPVPLIDFQNEVPCIEIRVEDQIINAKIALGFNGSLVLPEKMIQKLENKAFLHEIFYTGISGEKYRGPLFSLPKIQLGRLNFLNVETSEDKSVFPNSSCSQSFTGKFGWNFFSRLNLFLDCHLWMMAFCDSLETLAMHGFPAELFVECPFKMEKQFIEFEAITENGPLRCLLDTGSTNNFLNSNFSQENLVQNFKIGNEDFGPIFFHPIDTSFEVHAIIGMEFLHSKQLFIDFPNRKIYLSKL